jgi:hypothetical protein
MNGAWASNGTNRVKHWIGASSPFSTCNRNIAEDRALHIAATHPNFGARYSQKGKRIYEVKDTVGEIGRIRVKTSCLRPPISCCAKTT